MKKQLLNFKYLITSSLLLSSLFIGVSCSLESKKALPESNVLDSRSIPKVLTDATIDGLKLPNGTTTEIISDGSTVLYNFPNGIKLLKWNRKNNVFVESSGGSYTCTGSCSSGCDVFYVQGSFACSACSPTTVTCTGKSGFSGDPESVESMGFIDYNVGVSFVTNKQQLENVVASSPKFLFEVPAVIRAMKAFNVKVHGLEDPSLSVLPPSEYKEVIVNLFGTIVKYNVPKSYLEKIRKSARVGEESVEPMEGGKASCSCTQGTSGCKLDSGLGYTKCESGGCIACTMTVN
jgi:hypothetical protein